MTDSNRLLEEKADELKESDIKLKRLNEVFQRFGENPLINIQILVETVGELLEGDCAFYNKLLELDNKRILKTLAIWQEPPGYEYETKSMGHICTDIINEKKDSVVVIKDLDKTKYIKTDPNVAKFNLKQYCGCVIKLNKKSVATFCVVYTKNKEITEIDKHIINILSRSASIEEHRLYSKQKLKESEEKFRTIAEESMVGISIVQDNVFKYINQKLLDHLGYTREEIKNWKPGELHEILVPLDQREEFREFSRKIQSGKIKSTIHKELKLIKKNGEITWLDAYVRSIIYQDRPAAMNVVIDITDRKNSEDILRESEEKYRFITENVNDLISVFDKNLNLIYINDTLQKISGFSKKDVMGKKPMDFIHPDDINRCIKIFQETLKTGQGFGEFRFKRKDDSYVWLEVNAKIIVDKNGETNAILLSRDISKRKLMENKLKKSKEKYRLITEKANDIILVLNQKLECEYVNEQILIKLWGYNKDDLINKSVMKIIHPDDLELAANSLRKGFKKGEGETILRAKKKDGSYVWVEVRGKEFFNEEGIRKALLISRNITERKKAEDYLKESEEKFRIIAEQSFMGICILQDDRIKYINEAATKIFGYSSEEPLNWPIEYIIQKHIYPKDLPLLKETRRLRHLGDFNAEPYVSYRVVLKSGKIKWIEQYSKMIPYQGKKAELITFMDITERKEAERLIVEENKRLMELVKIRKNLITRISHELKTPLASIYGASELLLYYYKNQIKKSDYLELVEMIHRGGEKLKNLIEMLLDVSKIENDKLELNRQKEDLVEIIKECINNLRILVKNRKLDIQLNLPRKFSAKVDKMRLEQVIVNILTNAIKNTPSNGKIYVSLKKKENNAYIIIKDTGVGFTKMELGQIFKKFGKIERYGKGLDVDIEGSGLGLFISKEIIEAHKGLIWAQSKGRNKGSSFFIKLPLVS